MTAVSNSSLRFNARLLNVWLTAVCLTIFLMIVVGGVTRLTHSGLSMVDWKPIMGFIPPLGELEWQQTFDAYKAYPEYQKVNKGMSLPEFKNIFYWEYGHRVLGRIIGLVFFVPFVLLLATGRIERKLVPRLTFALFLGGLQGLMGWYMVMSGLVDMPQVSHFRLAAHLVLALIILSYLFWMILYLREVKKVQVSPGFRRLCMFILSLTSLQIIYGAFTAGLRAGLGFNTFPLMDGELIASAATMMTPLWINFVENGAMIQFVHRWLGTFLLLFVCGVFALSITYKLPRLVVIACGVLAALTFSQFLLGIFTLLNSVPVVLGSIHQAMACFVLLNSVFLVYSVGQKADSEI
jgi:cytochrome c oxidase assembly protein subunit 15